jgi:BNR repeat-like domain
MKENKMGRRQFFTLRTSTCLVFLLAGSFCWHLLVGWAAVSDGAIKIPVHWGVPWPKEGNAIYGYPTLPGVEIFQIYHATPLIGVYSHHSQIGHFQGRFFASWSNQEWGEDGPGQRVLCSLSQNGKSWRKPFVCFPSMGGMRKPERSGRVLTAEAWVVVEGKMYAVAGVNDKPGLTNKIASGYETTESGQKRMLFDGRVGWGRVARSVAADGDLGPIFWLVDDPPAPIEGFPSYANARDSQFQKAASEINRILANPLHMPAWDFLNHTDRPRSIDGHEMGEPTVYRRPDSVLVKLCRDDGPQKSHRLYASLSKDGGKTWAPAVRTDIPDSPAKAVSGTLPDGEIYLIGNQVPISAHGVRDPLVISLSADGKTFNRAAAIVHKTPPVRYPGRFKDLGFQYPSAIVVGKALWVIYSIDKEDVSVARIPLAVLGSTKIR